MACIHIILFERVWSIKDQIMQDFAEYRSVETDELEGSEADWELDPSGMLLGGLLGAILVSAWLKVSEYREMQPTVNQEINETVVEDTSLQFQFYSELKKNDLYPAFSEWISQACSGALNVIDCLRLQASHFIRFSSVPEEQV